MRIHPYPRPKTALATARLEIPSQWRARAIPALRTVVLFALFAALFAIVQFATPNLADNDGFYHMKMGLLIRAQGLRPPFVWLPLSILSRQAFYDHHLLFHVYLSLFTWNGSPEAMILGAKIASVVMPSLAFMAVWWLLRGQGVRWAWLWAVGLFAVSQAFLYRLSMPRAQSASLLVLALGLHWLLHRRYRVLLVLGFVYVWLYNAFPLLLALAGIYAACTFLLERRVEWKAVAYPALGIALGLIVNPYFPQNIAFIVNHLAPKIGGLSTPVGNEWYPYQTWTLVENSGLGLAAFAAGALALGWRGQRMDRPTLVAFALSLVFGFMLFKSRRFVEYYPAFALIFAALSISPLIEGWLAAHPRWARLASPLLAATLVAPVVLTLHQARAIMSTAKPADTYASASAWLKENTSPGSLVFQTDWDDFPRLFFYNTANLYTIGLDPTYMELQDADLYAEWVKITQGKVKHPSGAIHEHFGAEYVLSDLQHEAFIDRAKADPGLKEVYRDKYAVIFEVVR
jgi:hypothetical protein